MTLKKDSWKLLKILYVEDEPTTRKLTSSLLKRLFDNITICDNGECAVEKAKESKFDLIITDLTMPGLNGAEYIKYLKETALDTPIIALTAHSGDDFDDILSCCTMIQKPLILNELIEICGKIL